MTRKECGFSLPPNLDSSGDFRRSGTVDGVVWGVWGSDAALTGGMKLRELTRSNIVVIKAEKN